MTPFEKQFHKESQKIRLRVAEKRALREQILTYLEYHPIEERRAIRHPKAAERLSTAEHFVRIHVPFSSWKFRSAVSVFALVLFVGVPYAAERSVPGDVLYPVKVRVNEEVLATLSLSPYEKIEWETRRVERRIAEARLLAKEGRLTDEVEAVISQTVREHTEEANRGLAALKESDAEEAAVAQVALESALDVQTVVLETDTAISLDSGADEGETSGSQIVDLTEVVRTAKASVVAQGAAEPAVTPSYDRFMARVEQETTRARELFDSIDESVSAEERSEIERRLEDIDRQILAARDAHTLDASGSGVALLRTALSDTQKLISFMTDIDVRTSVALESLVPKKLTDEERVEALNTGVADLRIIRGDVVSRIGSSDDEALREKALLGVDQLDVLLDVIASSTEAGKIADAETALTLADALGNDLMLMVGNLPISTGELPSEGSAAEEAAATEESAEEAEVVTEETAPLPE